jgi:hypothetical protein
MQKRTCVTHIAAKSLVHSPKLDVLLPVSEHGEGEPGVV